MLQGTKGGAKGECLYETTFSRPPDKTQSSKKWFALVLKANNLGKIIKNTHEQAFFQIPTA